MDENLPIANLKGKYSHRSDKSSISTSGQARGEHASSAAVTAQSHVPENFDELFSAELPPKYQH